MLTACRGGKITQHPHDVRGTDTALPKAGREALAPAKAFRRGQLPKGTEQTADTRPLLRAPRPRPDNQPMLHPEVEGRAARGGERDLKRILVNSSLFQHSLVSLTPLGPVAVHIHLEGQHFQGPR